jgi:Cyclic nucleotide-binding domain/Acetyltransferase (GNAT) domain
MVEIRVAESADEKEVVFRFRYAIYVEEMGRYNGVADRGGRRLADPEDKWSWIAYALDDDEIVGTMRMTWGGAGFSHRQVRQYGLQPFLDELPHELLAVGERTMVSSTWRGEDLLERLGSAIEPLLDAHDVNVVFGACEPHLISHYCRFQRPCGSRNINSTEAGYLIPLVSFRPNAEALNGLGEQPGLPRCVKEVVAGSGTVCSPLTHDPAEYRSMVRAALASLGAPVFEGFTAEELERCVARSNIISCADGDRVLKKGGVARNVFVVLSGALEVSDDEHPVAVLLPGDVFGETAYLLEGVRTSEVDALSDDTRILSLSERTLRKLTADDPVVAAKLLGNLSKILCRRVAKQK